MTLWAAIKSLFGSQRAAERPVLDFDTIRGDVERVMRLDVSTPETQAANERAIIGVLKTLDVNIKNLRILADSYPANAIPATVWIDGAGCAMLASALTEHFKTAGWLVREENASELWVKATLAVTSHYRNLVGPAMLANADCHERLGNSQRALLLYGAVIKDFVSLVDDRETESDALNDEDRIAMQCLSIALERSLALAPPSAECDLWQELKVRTTGILNRATSDEVSNKRMRKRQRGTLQLIDLRRLRR